MSGKRPYRRRRENDSVQDMLATIAAGKIDARHLSLADIFRLASPARPAEKIQQDIKDKPRRVHWHYRYDPEFAQAWNEQEAARKQLAGALLDALLDAKGAPARAEPEPRELPEPDPAHMAKCKEGAKWLADMDRLKAEIESMAWALRDLEQGSPEYKQARAAMGRKQLELYEVMRPYWPRGYKPIGEADLVHYGL